MRANRFLAIEKTRGIRLVNNPEQCHDVNSLSLGLSESYAEFDPYAIPIHAPALLK
jgi:hypothetical protein